MSTPGKPLQSAEGQKALYRKVVMRILPVLMFGYVLAYLDRVNIGFAKLQMQSDLHLSDAVYGFGAGIFFIGYFLCETPSNVIMARVGARRWIARIMITWGVLSVASYLTRGEMSFYAVRFFLGVAEAGFFPGVILYLTYWFPNERMGSVTALFYSAIAISSAIGSPLSGWIMTSTAGAYGLSGWQWLFIIEGLPAVVFGLFTLLYLDDRVADAAWLTPDEKAFLIDKVRREQTAPKPTSWYNILLRTDILGLAAINFTIQVGIYGVSFWLPQLVKNTGVTSLLSIGMLSAIPWTIATFGMLVIAANSDRHNKRMPYLIGCMLLGAAGLAALPTVAAQTLPAMAALSIATLGILSALPLFWTIPTSALCTATAAAGIALINSIGSLGGFVAPYAFGALRDFDRLYHSRPVLSGQRSDAWRDWCSIFRQCARESRKAGSGCSKRDRADVAVRKM